MKARNTISDEARLEIKRRTQNMLNDLYSEPFNFSQTDLASALELSTRTLRDWANHSHSSIEVDTEFKIPTKQSFLKLCLIRVQIQFIPKEHKDAVQPSALLKYAAAPILLRMALSGAVGGGVSAASGAALALGLVPGIGLLSLIGLGVAAAMVSNFEKKMKNEKSKDLLLLVQQIQELQKRVSPSWESILEIIRKHECFFIK